MGRQAHEIVRLIISYSRHTCRNQGDQRSLFLETTKLYENKNLNVTRELASYNKSYLAGYITQYCRLLLSVDFPWQTITIITVVTPINFDNFSYVMSIKTTLANDKSQQHNLHYGSYRLFFISNTFISNTRLKLA